MVVSLIAVGIVLCIGIISKVKKHFHKNVISRCDHQRYCIGILLVELTLTFIRIKTQSFSIDNFHLSNELIEINCRFKMTNNWKKFNRIIFVHRPDETNWNKRIELWTRTR